MQNPSVNQYRQGEHICALYDSPEEQRSVAAEYLADGLRIRQRCFYVAESVEALLQFRRVLGSAGIDVDQCLRSRALVEATHADAHLVDGFFDCERMLASLNQAVESALNDGFTGLRTCGDMSWLLADAPGSDQVVEYEALLNQFFQGIHGCGMCQYHRRRIPPRLLDQALATHSSTVIEGVHKANPFFMPLAIPGDRPAHPDDLEWKIRER